MKITCEFCKGLYDDTLENCPNCGAANPSVRKATLDNPTTIEGLKEWYEAMNLPPYETTRFFIGIDYKEPKAFGIYKDENTGNFVVYKNKDTGVRAVRYEGTDEAFAVNELQTRLKQEIILQKERIAGEVSGSGTKPKKRKSDLGLALLLMMLFTGVGFGAFFLPMIYFFTDNPIKKAVYPSEGYYDVYDTIYYHMTDYSRDEWLQYQDESGNWCKVEIPSGNVLYKKKSSKDFFLAKDWDSSLACSDATNDILYHDYKDGYKIDTGYYSVNDTDFYHLQESQDEGWYYFDSSSNDWNYIYYDDIPSDLKHQYTAANFWYTPTWDSSTQITDFEDTDYYEDYQESLKSSSSSSSSSSDYSWDSSSSWDSGSTDWSSDW